MTITQQCVLPGVTCSSKSKYLEVKYLVLKEKVGECPVSIVGVSTYLMIVDRLTKALALKAHKVHGAIWNMNCLVIDWIL